MTKEIVEAVGVLEREKGIADRLMAALEDALSAYKKTPGAAKYARVEVTAAATSGCTSCCFRPTSRSSCSTRSRRALPSPQSTRRRGRWCTPSRREIDQERLAQYRDQIEEYA